MQSFFHFTFEEPFDLTKEGVDFLAVFEVLKLRVTSAGYAGTARESMIRILFVRRILTNDYDSLSSRISKGIDRIMSDNSS
jgi:hypothetical protein